MYGVSKINIEPSLMMISVQDVEFKGNSLARYLQIFADTGVVVDMISQSAPHGTNIDFSFTASASDLTLVMKAISAANLDKDAKASPLISVGYSKLNLFGEDMVTSCGVAARALNAHWPWLTSRFCSSPPAIWIFLCWCVVRTRTPLTMC